MKKSEILRTKLSGFRKVNWKDIFPAKNALKAQLDFYKSDIDVSKYAGKEYVDPEFGYPEPSFKINYVILNGEWEMDSFVEDEKHKLKIVDDKSGQFIEFAFSSFSDKVSFVNEIYSNKPIKQINTGINVESIVNDKINEKPKSWFPLIASMGLVAISYFFYKRRK